MATPKTLCDTDSSCPDDLADFILEYSPSAYEPAASSSAILQELAPAASPASPLAVQLVCDDKGRLYMLQDNAMGKLLVGEPPAEGVAEAPQQERQQKCRRRRRETKRKLHEVDEPFEDEEQERKRLNAINAKRHRDLKKQQMEALESQVEAEQRQRAALESQVKDVWREKKALEDEVEALRQQRQEEAVLKGEVEALRRENEQLKAQVEAFQTAAKAQSPGQMWNFFDDLSI